MAWIESHQAVGQHPKTIQLATALGVSLPTAVGHLHYLWWWALDFAPAGQIRRANAAVVAKACLWRGNPERFWQGLVDAGFIDVYEGGAAIHDWYDYAGKLLDRRTANTERMRSRRAAHVQDTDDARAASGTAHVQDTTAACAPATVPNRTGPNRTGPTETLRSQSSKANNSLPGSPRLARPAREARTREDPEPPVSNGFASMGSLIAEHEQRVAAERASQAKPSQPIENSLNGEQDEPC